MTEFAVRLPDVGEGVAEAELVEWLVEVGQRVTNESALAEVLTDKATVEISSPVAGVVTALHGRPGDRVAVGTELVAIALDDATSSAAAPSASTAPPAAPAPAVVPAPATGSRALPPPDGAPAPVPARPDRAVATSAARPLAAPAVRRRAGELGIDLHTVAGTGPGGQIVHADLDRLLVSGRAGLPAPSRAGPAPGADEPTVEPVLGVRRRIAERLTQAWTEIPHITYVEAVDATELELVRAELNRRRPDRPRLTLLPFVVRALVVACRDQPRLNAHYDPAAGTLAVHHSVHVGIATQTPDGLLVPVVRAADTRGLWGLATEIGRLADAARSGRATASDLSGSTITVTSLGALGGISTTPIINRPEVAIIGINKLEVRPQWRDGTFVPRTMFNVSASFDHRIVDGWDAATFVQRIKELLEFPALLLADDG